MVGIFDVRRLTCGFLEVVVLFLFILFILYLFCIYFIFIFGFLILFPHLLPLPSFLLIRHLPSFVTSASAFARHRSYGSLYCVVHLVHSNFNCLRFLALKSTFIV